MSLFSERSENILRKKEIERAFDLEPNGVSNLLQEMDKKTLHIYMQEV